jgi:3',5'-cyclic-nucleotide phosphodiesterase
MDLRVIGCHGGESPRHRTTAFVLDDDLTIDAGSLSSGLELDVQYKLSACLISHAHLDHIRDLATVADNRAQVGAPALVVAGTKGTIGILRKHFFNNLIWPDFSAIPTAAPAIRYLEIQPEKRTTVAGRTVRAVLVDHAIESSAYIVETGDGAIAYSGDTGPTDRLWEVLNEMPGLKALLIEVSFPNRLQKLATISGHHTPKTLAADLKKYQRSKDVPTMLYHMKPAFQAEVERECAGLDGGRLTVLRLGDHFVL